jgi:hypothetical protein
MFLSFAWVTYAQVTVGIPDLAVTGSGSVNIPIKVTNFNDVGAISLVINYDPSVLTFQGVPNPLSGNFLANAANGQIIISWFGLTPLNVGTGTLINLQCNYNGTGTSPLAFDKIKSEITNSAGTALTNSGSFTNGSVFLASSQPVNFSIPVTNLTNAGSDISVPVNVSNYNNIGATSLKISYNPSVLTFKGLANAPAGFSATASSGVINISYSTATAFTFGNGKLFDLNFNYVGGNSDLKFVQATASNILGTALTVNKTDGSITGPAAPTGQVTMSLPDTNVSINSSLSLPLNVEYFNNIGSISLKINYNKNVLTFKNIANTINNASEWQIGNDAVNGVITIGWNSTDAVTPINIQKGKLLDLLFDFKEGSSPLTFNAETYITNITNNAVNVSFKHGMVSAPRQIALGNIKANVSDVVLVPLSVNNLTNVGSVSLSLTYNPQVVKFLGLENNPNVFYATNPDAANGTIVIGWSSQGGTINPLNVVSGKLLDLKFQYLDKSTDLSFNTAQCQITDVNLNVINSISYINGSVSKDISFELANVRGNVNSDVNVPIKIKNITKIGSMSLQFKFDPSKVEFKGIKNFTGNPDKLQANSVPGSGILKVGFADVTPLDVLQNKILDLVFTYKTNSVAAISADVANCEVTDTELGKITGITYIDGSISPNQKPSISSVAPKVTAEGATLKFNLTVTDPENDPLNVTLSNLPADAKVQKTATPNVWEFSWTPNYSQAGSYVAKFSVADSIGATDTSSVIISVANTPQPITFTKVMPDTTIKENQLLNYSYKATSLDEQTDGVVIKYKLNGAPAGLTIDTTGKIAWTPDYSAAEVNGGIYQFTVTAFGNTLEQSVNAKITVLNVNRKPTFTKVLPDTTINEAQDLAYQYAATDPDAGATLTYTLAKAPAGAKITTDGKFTFSPTYDQAGTYQVIAVVSDGQLTDTSKTSIVIVNNVNRKPVFTKVLPDTTINEAQDLTFQYVATDPDAEDTLTYSLAKAPTGAKITKDGKFTFSPTYDQAGTYQVIAVVSDGKLTDTSKTSVVVVINQNRAPKFTTTAIDTTINENQAYAYTFVATDPDAGSNLTYSVTGAPTGATINAATGAFAWTPTYDQAGTYNFKAFVSDGALKDSVAVKITVKDVDRAPKFTTTAIDTTINENQAYAYTFVATDPDAGTTLTYSIAGAPTGATINAATGAFAWTPSYDQAGIYNFKAFVSDGTLKDSVAVKITVTGVDRAPKFVTTAIDTTINENQAYAYTFKATDPDTGTTLTYSVTGAPTGATINAATGVFAWTPTYDQAGTYNFKAFVSDGVLKDSVAVKITVKDVNRAPKFTTTALDTTINENQAMTYAFKATDPDGNAITYSMTGAPTGAAIVLGTGAFSWTPGYDQAGTYNFKVFASDGTLKDSVSVKITVKDVSRPPVFTKFLTDCEYTGNAGIGSDFKFTYEGNSPEGKQLAFFIAQAPAGSSINAISGAFVWHQIKVDTGSYVVKIGLTDGHDTVYTSAKVHVPQPLKVYIESGIPTEYALSQNFPNPFNPSTYIKYSIPKESKVTVKVFNMVGQEVMTLVNEMQSVGNYAVEFNASKLASGIYIYRIQADKFVSTKKMILVK